MAYSTSSSSNAYSKPHSQYSLLDDSYLKLIASPPQSLYPPMKFQNVAFNNIKLGYDALTEGTSQTGYGEYNQAYPSACSQYNVVQCPTNKVLYPFDKSPLPKIPSQAVPTSAAPTLASPAPLAIQPLPAHLLEQYKRLGVRLFISTDSAKPCIHCKNAIHLLQQHQLLPFTQVLNVQDPAVMKQLTALGGKGVPLFHATATNAVVPRFVPSVTDLIHMLSLPAGSPAPAGGGGTDFFLLTNDACPHCRAFTQNLKAHNLSHYFQTVPVTDTARMKTFANLKLSGVPAMVARSRKTGEIKEVVTGMPDMHRFKSEVQRFLKENQS